MKKFLAFILLLSALLLTYLYREKIVLFIFEKLSNINNEITININKDYYRDYNLSYVKLTDNYNVRSTKDLLNLYYTAINAGMDEFKFYCSTEYETCIDDIVYLSEEQTILSNINNFVHPYNRFTSLKTTYDTLRQVTITLEKTYTKDKQNKINDVVDKIIKEEIKEEKDPEKIIRIVHDYIINNTKYDKERADKNIIKYESHTAYGVLIEHYGLCGGYADAVALFLDKYEIPNFKVVSENHIWNAVFLKDNWYHLDLTWDDPVLTSGDDTLEYTFFLITTDELEDLETNQHIFNKKVFTELDY